MRLTAKRLAQSAMILAALFSQGLDGQNQPAPAPNEQQPKQKPPLVAECEAVNTEFVKGQNVELRCAIAFLNGVNFELDKLKKIGGENFEVLQLSVTEPAPIPNQKDYNLVSVTEVLKPAGTLKYGAYPVEPAIDYAFPETSWQDENGKQVLKTKTVRKTLALPKIAFQKLPLVGLVDQGDGFQDTVNIGEHTFLGLKVFYETGAVQILNGKSPYELEKYRASDATPLDKPDLAPFTVIDDGKPCRTKIKADYVELDCRYRLALYDISLIKTFPVPSINIYYKFGDQVIKLMTPPLQIRTNSVLNKESEFRPFKKILEPDPDMTRNFGWWPQAIGKTLFGICALVILYCLALFTIGKIKKIHNAGFLASCQELLKTLATRLGLMPAIRFRKVWRCAKKLHLLPSQTNLKQLIVALRLYLGAEAKISDNLALSYTVTEFEQIKTDARLLMIAENMLDENEEVFTQDFLCMVKQNLKDLKNNLYMKEVGPWS